MKERWKHFHRGYYEVSNKGRVRNSQTKQVLRIGPNKAGYVRVRVCVNYVKDTYMVHCLVARKFIGPCPEGKEVNHKDLDKGNNYYKNLEYMTRSKNIQHAIVHGVHFGWRKGHRHPKITWDQAKWIRSAKGLWSTQALADLFGVSYVTITNVLKHRTWKKRYVG